MSNIGATELELVFITDNSPLLFHSFLLAYDQFNVGICPEVKFDIFSFAIWSKFNIFSFASQNSTSFHSPYSQFFIFLFAIKSKFTSLICYTVKIQCLSFASLNSASFPLQVKIFHFFHSPYSQNLHLFIRHSQNLYLFIHYDVEN